MVKYVMPRNIAQAALTLVEIAFKYSSSLLEHLILVKY